MNRRYFLSDTWQGTVFGSVLLLICWTFFVAPQLITVLEYAFPEWSRHGFHGITGGLAGGLIAVSCRILKPYWNWADRVMGKLFRDSEGSDEREDGFTSDHR